MRRNDWQSRTEPRPTLPRARPSARPPLAERTCLTCLLARQDCGHTEAAVLPVEVRWGMVAKRRPASPCVPTSLAAATRTPRAFSWTAGIVLRRLGEVVRCIAIRTPFNDASVHIVQSPSVWFPITYFVSLVAPPSTDGSGGSKTRNAMSRNSATERRVPTWNRPAIGVVSRPWRIG